MKADFRISVKDFRRGKTLRVQLSQVPFARQFWVRMNGAKWPGWPPGFFVEAPEAVNASAVFQVPNASRVVYDASADGMLDRYELRGNVGDRYSNEDAVVIASRGPNDAREFVTSFGLNQPGAEVALKAFVVLTTGNEAGSASMLVERPAGVELLAA